MIEVLARVFSSTRLTITAQYSPGPDSPLGKALPACVPETTTELQVPIAGLQPCIEQERTRSLVMNLADRPEPRMTRLACIQDVVVTVHGHAAHLPLIAG